MTEPRPDATDHPRRHKRRRVAEGRRRPTPKGRRLGAFATVARLAGPPAVLSIVATVVLAADVATFQQSRGLAVNIWLLIIGGLLVWTCLRALASALPTAGSSAFDSLRIRPAEPPSKRYEVVDIEGAILDAEWHSGGVEFRLRPLLRRIAASRLIERHQVDLETDPAAAHLILGDELWALLQPETEPRTDGARHDKGRRGIPRATIRRAIDVLEAL